jgi:hypothetical protein
MAHQTDAEFRDFVPHEGGLCPYQPDDKVDVQFADGRIEYDALASYWMNREGEQGMWSHSYSNPRAHIIASRLAGNVRWCRGLVEID